MQTGMEYGMLVDGAPWEQLYTAATDFVLSETGKTAAVVQTAGLGQADLEGFQQGHLYHRRRRPSMGRVLPERVVALLRQGRPPGRQHRARHAVRIYHFHQRPALERNLPLCVGTHLRAQIRRRHRAHPQGRQMGPRPQRLPLLEAHVRAVLGASGSRHRRRIHLGRRRAFLRCLHRGLQRHPVELPFPSVTDLVLSPDGKHAAALGSQNNSRFQIAVDGKVWDDAFDMAWPVVFSPPPGTAPPPRSAAAASSPCNTSQQRRDRKPRRRGTPRSARTAQSCCSVPSRTAAPPPCGSRHPTATRNSSECPVQFCGRPAGMDRLHGVHRRDDLAAVVARTPRPPATPRPSPT